MPIFVFYFFRHEKFDVVFLQEVWFEKDYNFLAECTKPKYHISAYDKEFCGAADKVCGALGYFL